MDDKRFEDIVERLECDVQCIIANATRIGEFRENEKILYDLCYAVINILNEKKVEKNGE